MIQNSSGVVTGFQGIVRNITEHRRIEEELRALSRQNELILNAAGEGILGIDVNGIITFCNPAGARMTGYSIDELIGKQCHETLHYCTIDGISSSWNECPTYQAIQSGQPQHATGEFLWRKDGTSFPVDYTISPIRENGRTVGAVVSIQDITERKKSEELLLKSAKLSAVGQLAANVAHELRNPLTCLKGFIRLLESHTTAKKSYFTIIQSEFTRIENIINEFLLLAKPQKLNFQMHNLCSLLKNVIDLLEPESIVSNIQFDVSNEGVIPPIYCDDSRIKQVLLNILKNAVEAMPHGGTITIRTSMTEDEQALSIRIIDEGLGISEADMPNLGEPFFTTKSKGTGLGLMVSRKIIESHNGTLRMESRAGEGTTVEILLPLLSESVPSRALAQ